jgi:RHS repeat-associated protein
MGVMRSFSAAALCVAGLAGSISATPPPYHFTGQIWSPFELASAHSVPGHPLPPPGHPGLPQVKEPGGHTAVPFLAKPSNWPAPGTGIARLTAQPGPLPAGGTTAQASPPAAATQAGTLPVWLAPAVASLSPRTGNAAPQPAPGSVRVTLAGHADTVAAGVTGLIMTLTRVDQGTAAASVVVRVNYAGIAANYGGGWASRLRLVQLPGCALTAPDKPGCRAQRPLASSNDADAQTVTAPVSLSTRDQLVLAAAASPAGPQGNYTATSLKPSGTWAVQNGDFSYSYPISVPPSLGGAAPTVALTYDSQSIDSETSGQNTQASWIGDGWDYQPGFIERSYKQCSNDGIANSGDECWGGYNATLSLNGHSGVLVRDDGTAHAWHLQGDDGTQVQLLTGASNGLWSGEYWLVTTTDGTRYYFGVNHLPGGGGTDPAANSAWGVPVYNPGASDPCNSSTWCQMGWRWNLDYVVDPHGNLRTYNYSTETNYYERGGGQNNGTGTLTSYVRGGYLNSVAYGYRLSDAISGAKPAAEITFSTRQRCVSSASYTCGSAGPTSLTASNWPDVPFDQNCASSGSCANDAPSFWSTMRLDSITTEVLAGGSPKLVDTYTLSQTYPDAGGASQPVMFLNTITRTGNDGGTLSLPAVMFTPTEIDNRVDGLVPAAPPLYRPRISSIATEAGAGITVLYSAPACSRVNNTMPSSPDSNIMPCFPVYWTPPGEASPIQDWFTKSLVHQVTVADQTKVGSPVQTTTYQYLGGAAWHQDTSPVTNNSYRTWDQFRGYAQVITTTGAAPDPLTETETTYLRGMNGDATSGGGTRSASVSDSLGDSVTDDDWLAGQVLETDTYTASGGSVVAKSVNGPWTFRTTASQAMTGSLPVLTARMLQTQRTRQLGLLAGGSWRTTQSEVSYNSADQVVQADDKGDGSASDPETCTSTSYAVSSANPMMVSYPDEVKQVTGSCGTTATAADTVSDTRTFYDGSGTLTNMGTFGTIPGPGDVTGTEAISGYDLNGNPVYQPETAASYDAYGRGLTATDANSNITRTAYTPATGALPTQTAVTNPMGWTTITALDQLRQLPVQVTDPNARVTTETYDPLGRVTAVWQPGRSQAGGQSADQTFAYSETGTAPVAVTTSTLREDGSYSADVKIYDGMLQLRQEQTTTADNSAGRLISDTFHDSHGWVVKTSAPYYDATTAPDTTVFLAGDSQVPSQTVTQYDGQGRVTASQFYSLGTLQWQTTTAYPGVDETDVTPPAGGTATSTFTNSRGEKTAQWVYTTATPTRKQGDAVVTSYSYTPSGQIASVTDNASNKWVYTYNLLGRKISQTDPDAGTTTYGYDANGNLTASTDARNQVLAYTYDALNRKTGEYAGSVAPANQLAGWVYDTVDKGQLTSSTAYTGGASGSAYTEEVSGYDTSYQPTGTSIIIPASEGALAGTYTTTNTYTPTVGLLNSTAYSGDGGLPAETVGYSYDLQGLQNAFGGSTAYLDKTSYSPFGQVQRTTTGLYGKQLVVTDSYDQGTSRLLQTTTNLQTLNAAADTVNYTYNQAGSTTSVSDSENTGQNDLQCYGYDNLQRLTQAWTDTGVTSTAPGPSVSGIGGCTTSTPSPSTIGGPAPYWQSYGYDPLGDRTSQTQHQASGDITQALSYPGNGTSPAAQPNQVSSVTTSGPNGTSTATYSYDLAGNTKARSGSSALSFGYDQQGRTSSATSSGGTSGYLYDADGNLLIRRDPGSTTLYLDNGAEELTLAHGAVSGLRYYTEPDSTTIVRSSGGQLSYELANHQHTALESVDAGSLAVTRRYFDPYGDPRGTVPGSWPDQHAFVGKPTDPTTSLDLLGARQYDPATGRFLQVDPLLETSDPRQLGGYSYAADNPVNNSDPAGLRACIDACGSAADQQMAQDVRTLAAQEQQAYWQNMQGAAENQALDSCASSNCFTHTIRLFSNPAWASAQATRYQNEIIDDERIAQAQQSQQAVSGGGGGGGGFWGFVKKAVKVAGQVTGVTDAIDCIKNPTALGCLKAVVKLGLTATAVVTVGSTLAGSAAADTTELGLEGGMTSLEGGSGDAAATAGAGYQPATTEQLAASVRGGETTSLRQKAACLVLAACITSSTANLEELKFGAPHIEVLEPRVADESDIFGGGGLPEPIGGGPGPLPGPADIPGLPLF